MRHLINSVTGCVWWWWVLLKEGLFWWTWQIPTLPSGIKLVLTQSYKQILINQYFSFHNLFRLQWWSLEEQVFWGTLWLFWCLSGCYSLWFNLQNCLIFSDLRLETVSIRLLLRWTLLTGKWTWLKYKSINEFRNNFNL